MLTKLVGDGYETTKKIKFRDPNMALMHFLLRLGVYATASDVGAARSCLPSAAHM